MQTDLLVDLQVLNQGPLASHCFWYKPLLVLEDLQLHYLFL